MLQHAFNLLSLCFVHMLFSHTEEGLDPKPSFILLFDILEGLFQPYI